MVQELLNKDLVMDRLVKHQTFDSSARGTEGEAARPLSDVYPYAAIQQLILLLRIAVYVARVDHEMVCT